MDSTPSLPSPAYSGRSRGQYRSRTTTDLAPLHPNGSESSSDASKELSLNSSHSIVDNNQSEEDVDEYLEFRLKSRNDGIMRVAEEEEKPPQIVMYTNGRLNSSDLSITSPIRSSSDSPIGGIRYERGISPLNIEENQRKSPLHEECDTKPKNINPSAYSHLELESHDPMGNFPSLDKEEQSDEEQEEWQNMKTVGEYEIYDDKNNVLVHRQDSEEIENEDLLHIQAAKGYTRVTGDEDAKSINSMDEETGYLFDDDELARNPLSQLQATKDMLTDSQKIGYVGLCRLIMNDQAMELTELKSNRKTRKSLSNAQGSMAMWSQMMMMRLYKHMDMSSEEQIMIEQLPTHGVLPSDLTPNLRKVTRIRNPLNKRKTSLANAQESEIKPLSSVPEVLDPSSIQNEESLDIDIRWTLLCDLFLVLISDSVYDSRSRTMLSRTGEALGISFNEIAQFEKRVTDSLEIEEAGEQHWDETEIMEERRKKALRKKYAYVGLATVGGGLVIGLSAGLLAPVIGAGLAAGLTTIGIGGTSGFLAGAGGAAVVTSTGAAIGAHMGQSGMRRRMGHVKTFEFRPLHNNKRVNAIVTVSGWMSSKEDDVRLPFSTVDPIMGDLFSVLWEPEMLQSMGQTINILATEALTQTIQQVLGNTLLISLMASIQLPMALSKLSYLLDNPWNVSLDRAWSSGLILADSLIKRNLGVRPITLVGFSLGARVIYSCLVELARREQYGLIQDVYIFGAPFVVKRDQFQLCRSVVSGRFVNGFSRKDWILGYLFRATAGGLGRIAGLASIDGYGHLIENMDCTDMIDGHMGYRRALPKLLSQLGWEVLSEDFVEIDDPDPEQYRERQRELIKEFDEARKQMEEEKNKQKKGFFSWLRPKRKEWWEMAQKASDERTSLDNPESNIDVMFDLDEMQREVANIAAKEIGETNGTRRSSSRSLSISTTGTIEDAFTDDYGERRAEKMTVQSEKVPEGKIEEQRRNGRSNSIDRRSLDGAIAVPGVIATKSKGFDGLGDRSNGRSKPGSITGEYGRTGSITSELSRITSEHAKTTSIANHSRSRSVSDAGHARVRSGSERSISGHSKGSSTTSRDSVLSHSKAVSIANGAIKDTTGVTYQSTDATYQSANATYQSKGRVSATNQSTNDTSITNRPTNDISTQHRLTNEMPPSPYPADPHSPTSPSPTSNEQITMSFFD